MKTVFSSFVISLKLKFIFRVHFCTDEINRSESQLTSDWSNDVDDDGDDRLGFR